MITRRAAVLYILFMASLISSCLPGLILSRAQAAGPIDELMSQLSPAQRVGQLFLVTFSGSEAGPTSDIALLVREYRVGGVMLLPANGNFRNEPTAPEQIIKLNGDLQRWALNANRATPVVAPSPELGRESAVSRFPGIPLFIAVDQEGDGFPYTSIRDGVTALPSNLAVGATWKVEDAARVGEIAGRELAALGVNLLLGPSLDVLNTPRPAFKGDLAGRSFGGDPFWVGRLGQAYIKGVHEGSDGRVATVATHFPGLGAADRRPDEEVPTVPKSLAELRNLELVPFIAAVRGSDTAAIADALMSTHIRYRGFQGNIRQLTRPISLDPQNLQMLLSEPGLSSWREQGGIVVSDALGVPAVRRYYDPQMQTFPYKRIAQDALLAGNDLLMLRQFGLTDTWAEQFESIKATIQFFQEKYASDPNFQTRVDQSVRRVLQAKLRLYGQFDVAKVVVGSTEAARTLGRGRAAVQDIARDAVTLIYPAADELADRVSGAPALADNVLIFTDAREFKECAWCPGQPMIPVDALEKVMLRLYGAEGSGQIDPARLHSVSFAQLKTSLLSAPSTKTVEAPQIDGWIARADWIIFAMLDVNADESPASDAVKVFLKLRSDSLRDKRLVVLAFGAPYHLDTTEISKLTAYYGMYSKAEPFIEASVRTLFQEYTPTGALPVSVDGINYDLIMRTAPDPRQIIQVQLADEAAGGQRQSVDVKVGKTLHVKTNTIIDRNGHGVPDGTPVSFRLTYPAEAMELPRREVTTLNGAGEISITLEREGQLQITAHSDPAYQSTTLIVTIQGERPATIATLVPSPPASITATTGQSGTAAVGSGTGAPEPVATTATSSTAARVRPRVKQLDLWLALLGMISLNLIADLLRWRRGWTRVFRLRLSLMGLISGLIGYLVYAIGLLDTGALWRIYGHLGSVLFGVGFSLIPLVAALIGRGIRAAE